MSAEVLTELRTKIADLRNGRTNPDYLLGVNAALREIDKFILQRSSSCAFLEPERGAQPSTTDLCVCGHFASEHHTYATDQFRLLFGHPAFCQDHKCPCMKFRVEPESPLRACSRSPQDASKDS